MTTNAEQTAAGRGPGRPPIGKPVPVRLGELTARVDEWAAHHGNVTRAEAVRRLVGRALDAETTRDPP